MEYFLNNNLDLEKVSMHNSLLKLLEKWRQSLDQGLMFGVLLTDLSQAFDCPSHELLVATLSAYGAHISAVCFIYDYLSDRKQKN